MTINGVNVSSDYITGEADVSLCKHVGDYVTTPVDDVYNINGMLPSQRLRLPIMAKSLILNMLKMDMRHIIHQMMSFFQARRAIY